MGTDRQVGLLAMAMAVARTTVAAIMMAAAVIAIIVFAVMIGPAAQAQSLPPRDDCLRIDGYRELRRDIDDIVRSRDAQRLLALTDESILSSFGEDETREAFEQTWRLREQGAASAFWREFEAVLSLGCGMRDGALVFPYQFASEAPEPADPFATFLTLGSAVPMRARPAERAPQTGTLDWDLIEQTDISEDGEWSYVAAQGGREGWVRQSGLRSMVDFRAQFQRREGQWRLTVFVAGD